MVTSACAAPLIVDFGGSCSIDAANEPPFTCVHSHAGAQKIIRVFSAIQTGMVPEMALRPQKRAEGVPGGAGKNSLW